MLKSAKCTLLMWERRVLMVMRPLAGVWVDRMGLQGIVFDISTHNRNML